MLTGLALAAAPLLVVGLAYGGAVERVPTAFVRAGEPAPVAAVAVFPDGRCLAAREGATFEGRRCSPVPPEVAASARWSLAVPQARDYDNTVACTGLELAHGCHAPIEYQEVELEGLRGVLAFDAALVPALAAPGAHRLALRLNWEGQGLAAPAEALAPASDGTVPRWFEVAVRRGDGYVGFLTELLGAPFALVPTVLPAVGHQTDARLAADCVALVIYGRRRMGAWQPYLSPDLVRARMETVGRAEALLTREGGVAEVGPVREGDVLHFGFQTAVLARDLPPLGHLDAWDVIIQTYHGVAEELPVSRLPYGRNSVEVLRWKEPPPERPSP